MEESVTYSLLALGGNIDSFTSSWGALCRPSYDETLDKWTLPLGWEDELTERGIPFGIIEISRLNALSTIESRQAIIDQLTVAAENSGLSVPFESFYYKYRKEIFNWVNNGGNTLIEIFTNDTSEWLDMRETEDSLSPREFALGLLIPTTEKSVLNEIITDETDVVETSVWQKIKNWFNF